jgi:hypothetical protein
MFIISRIDIGQPLPVCRSVVSSSTMTAVTRKNNKMVWKARARDAKT